MKSKSKSLRRLIVACAAVCALFVLFISFQSWGTLDIVFNDIPADMADVQWLRITLVVGRYVLALAMVATLLVFLFRISSGAIKIQLLRLND